MTEEPRAGEPALTNEEWARREIAGEWLTYTLGHDSRGGPLCIWVEGQYAEAERPHALAALCLHGQEYGFSWADVDALHLAADACEDACTSSGEQWAKAVLAVAARIAALLPPR